MARLREGRLLKREHFCTPRSSRFCKCEAQVMISLCSSGSLSSTWILSCCGCHIPWSLRKSGPLSQVESVIHVKATSGEVGGFLLISTYLTPASWGDPLDNFHLVGDCRYRSCGSYSGCRWEELWNQCRKWRHLPAVWFLWGSCGRLVWLVQLHRAPDGEYWYFVGVWPWIG